MAYGVQHHLPCKNWSSMLICHRSTP